MEASHTNYIKRRGLMFVLTSPSGTGKTTLSRMLLKDDPLLSLSVSVTTRPERKGERNGQDYHFVSRKKFEDMRRNEQFLEHAYVFDHYYGTLRSPVEEVLSGGRDVLFDIDWQGTQQLEERTRDDLVRVFLLPPSATILQNRLRMRAQDSESVVEQRMMGAAGEIKHYAEYDYIIVNHDLDESLYNLKAILCAERLRRTRQIGLADFVSQLSSEL
ncbi:MAG: guanylate kinase [Parvularculales bacterium]